MPTPGIGNNPGKPSPHPMGVPIAHYSDPYLATANVDPYPRRSVNGSRYVLVLQKTLIAEFWAYRLI